MRFRCCSRGTTCCVHGTRRRSSIDDCYVNTGLFRTDLPYYTPTGTDVAGLYVTAEDIYYTTTSGSSTVRNTRIGEAFALMSGSCRRDVTHAKSRKRTRAEARTSIFARYFLDSFQCL